MIQKKVCMIGTSAVGKTSLVAQYVHSMFSEKYLTTVGVKVDKKIVTLDGQEVQLVIWDLAGDDDFQRLRMSYLRGTSGYLLVADGTRAVTLDQALDVQERVTQAIGSVPCVLALNKADLAAQWEITDERVESLSAGGHVVLRTSARDGSGVEEAFAKLARQLVPSRPQ